MIFNFKMKNTINKNDNMTTHDRNNMNLKGEQKHDYAFAECVKSTEGLGNQST